MSRFSPDCQVCKKGDVCNDPQCKKKHCKACDEFRAVALKNKSELSFDACTCIPDISISEGIHAHEYGCVFYDEKARKEFDRL